MKALRRAYKVLLNDYQRIRLHQAEAAALPVGAPPLAPLTLDAHPSLGPELTEWLVDNCSKEKETAKSIRNGVDDLIQLEKTSIARSCAMVYASLSPTVQRDAAAGFATNVCIASFRRFRGILPATNKNMQLPSPFINGYTRSSLSLMCRLTSTSKPSTRYERYGEARRTTPQR
ncbi:hypothetical protein DYB37_013615 [Aphanomyces astaci]|uniref:Uncharacterized protein n=1 Tax=Aphanomyces astaci TaxID=112090 RepID=A0A3R7BWY7_APHAT|nr:hypothetical protein DYB37_013615 [Aphanomyces astaci]